MFALFHHSALYFQKNLLFPLCFYLLPICFYGEKPFGLEVDTRSGDMQPQFVLPGL